MSQESKQVKPNLLEINKKIKTDQSRYDTYDTLKSSVEEMVKMQVTHKADAESKVRIVLAKSYTSPTLETSSGLIDEFFCLD